MQLTANEELELRYMQALGYKWIARDKTGEVFAYKTKPYRENVCFGCENNDYVPCSLGEYEELDFETKPLEIDKLLMENGWDIPLVEPKWNEL